MRTITIAFGLFVVFSDEELEKLLDRSDMLSKKENGPKKAVKRKHSEPKDTEAQLFEVL